MQKYSKVHPVALQFPRLTGARFNEFKADIAANGIRIPILVDKKKTLLDGRNRVAAAHDLKLKDNQVPVEVFKGTDEEAVKEIISRNLQRRDLTEDQRVSLMAKLMGDTFEKEAAADRKAGVAKNGERKGEAADRLAKGAKVSQHKARAALQTRKHDPEGLDNVIAGKEKLAEANKKAKAKAGKTAKPKTEKPLLDRVQAKFIKFMEGFAVTEYAEVRAILRDLLKKAEK